jgi:hypothetical protein
MNILQGRGREGQGGRGEKGEARVVPCRVMDGVLSGEACRICREDAKGKHEHLRSGTDRQTGSLTDTRDRRRYRAEDHSHIRTRTSAVSYFSLAHSFTNQILFLLPCVCFPTIPTAPTAPRCAGLCAISFTSSSCKRYFWTMRAHTH